MPGPQLDRHPLAVGGEDCCGDAGYGSHPMRRLWGLRTWATCHHAVRGSIGSQMLILRVSGIRKSASTKHAAGTAIG